MLQENSLTGLFFFLGILAARPDLALCALLACLVATLTAMALGYDRDALQQGLYGYNAVLVGIAVPFYLPLTLYELVLLSLGAVASVPVTRLGAKILAKLDLPALTAPFVVVTWAALALYGALSHTPPAGPAWGLESGWPFSLLGEIRISPWPDAVFKGVGEVMFQGNPIAGLLFLAGLAVASWKNAAAGLGGSALGCLAGYLVLGATPEVMGGLYGYNAVLCAIAMVMFIKAGPVKTMVAAAACVLLSCVLFRFTGPLLAKVGLPGLTLAFVLSAWICLYMGKKLIKPNL